MSSLRLDSPLAGAVNDLPMSRARARAFTWLYVTSRFPEHLFCTINDLDRPQLAYTTLDNISTYPQQDLAPVFENTISPRSKTPQI